MIIVFVIIIFKSVYEHPKMKNYGVEQHFLQFVLSVFQSLPGWFVFI